MITVAVLTTPYSRHELYRVGDEYRIITTPPGEEPADFDRLQYGSQRSAAEAGEWIDACRRDGGTVYEEVRHA